eukprot:TRINITY_DN9362_c0_g1_i3.p2 TRINITY_DN9362_c0_g1~~TRINITY_DN9362_c0_g1_i3.p2  ORF type:complete len:129 (-),score=0.77 TRINITY_DN9362_c0_g1_i3:287-673(-)
MICRCDICSVPICSGHEVADGVLEPEAVADAHRGGVAAPNLLPPRRGISIWLGTLVLPSTGMCTFLPVRGSFTWEGAVTVSVERGTSEVRAQVAPRRGPSWAGAGPRGAPATTSRGGVRLRALLAHPC